MSEIDKIYQMNINTSLVNFDHMKQEIYNISNSNDKSFDKKTISTVQIPNQHVNMILHGHQNGMRKSVEFIKKDYYTFDELLQIINNIDNSWEETNRQNFTYVR